VQSHAILTVCYSAIFSRDDGGQKLHLGILDDLCCQEEVEVQKEVGSLYMRQPWAGSIKNFCMLIPKLSELRLETSGPVDPVLTSCIKLFEKVE
jgi:hypothetical protein